jgi:hypothetical protein
MGVDPSPSRKGHVENLPSVGQGLSGTGVVDHSPSCKGYAANPSASRVISDDAGTPRGNPPSVMGPPEG